jgi:L-asparagine oxygenase
LNCQEFIDGDVRGPLAIIRGSFEDPFMLFDQDLMHGLTEEAEEMIGFIVDIYKKHRIGHVLQPGEIFLIDNNRSMHGRSSFSPKYDGYDRFLVRCFAVFNENYEKSAYARPNSSHTVAAVYS